MMSELLKAIFARYAGSDGSALRALTIGGMWLSQAPESAFGVYIVVTPVAAPVSYAMGTSATKVFTQDCDIQFALATTTGTASDIAAAMTAFHSLYDFCTFTITDHTLLSARRLSDQGPMRDDLSSGYVSYIEIRFTIGG